MHRSTMVKKTFRDLRRREDNWCRGMNSPLGGVVLRSLFEENPCAIVPERAETIIKSTVASHLKAIRKVKIL